MSELFMIGEGPACVLLLDTSRGMSKEVLGNGLKLFCEAFKDSSDYPEICVVTFNSEVKVIVPFTVVNWLEIPEIEISDSDERAVNQAILAGLEQIKERKRKYRFSSFISKPDIFLLTSSLPSDHAYENEACKRMMEVISEDAYFDALCIHSVEDTMQLKRYVQPFSGMLLHTNNNLITVFSWLATKYRRSFELNKSLAYQFARHYLPANIKIVEDYGWDRIQRDLKNKAVRSSDGEVRDRENGPSGNEQELEDIREKIPETPAVMVIDI